MCYRVFALQFAAVAGWLGSLVWNLPACGIELADLVEQVEPSVVRIDTDKGIGSGVLVDGDGRIITNYHVIDGARHAKVTFRDKATFNVSGYLAVDFGRDLALLQIGGKPKPAPLPLADALPRKGERVAAFGSPKGFSFSTSEGIVSGLRSGKEINKVFGLSADRARGGDPAAMWIQTTAAISGGNSGGPLVNMRGELVGLNTLVTNDAQNLNFAISISDIKLLINKGETDTKPFAHLPKSSEDVSSQAEFKLLFPSGRVFSFDIFAVEQSQYRRLLEGASHAP